LLLVLVVVVGDKKVAIKHKPDSKLFRQLFGTPTTAGE
jgi:hypothetical protein